jgi:uncharacterized protein with GYD domain
MPYYLVQATYTPEASPCLVENPEHRRESLHAMAKRARGTLHRSWLACGDHDAIFIYEMLDNARMANGLVAASLEGALRELKTTQLMNWEEGAEAMRVASEITYRPPWRLEPANSAYRN